jgi:hypothetical protein
MVLSCLCASCTYWLWNKWTSTLLGWMKWNKTQVNALPCCCSNFNSCCAFSVQNSSHLLLTLNFSLCHLFSFTCKYSKTNQYINYSQHSQLLIAPIYWYVCWRFKFLTTEPISCSETLISSKTFM